MRFTIRMSVVLPHPEVPRNTVVVCGAIVKEKSSTAFVSGGYIFDTWSKVIMIFLFAMTRLWCVVANLWRHQRKRPLTGTYFFFALR